MIKSFLSFDKSTKLFLVATGMMGLSNGLFDAVYNFYLESQGLDKISIGKIYAIAMLMMSITVIPLIIASRRISVKKLLIFSSVVYALPFLALPLISSVPVVSICLGLILSGMISVLSTGNTIFGSHVGGENKTRLFTLFFVFYLGAAMLATFAVVAITKYSFFNLKDSYTFILSLSFFVAITMLVLRIFSVRNVSDSNINSAIESASNSKIEWFNFLILSVSSLLLGGSITLVFRFANILFNEAYLLDISQASMVLGFDKIISIVGATCAPILIRNINLKFSLIFIGISTFILLICQTFYLPLVIFMLLYFSRLFLNYALMPLLDTLTITGFNKSRVLISTSTRQASFYLGGAFSAMIYGNLFQKHDWAAALVCSAIMALLGALGLSFIKENKIA